MTATTSMSSARTCSVTVFHGAMPPAIVLVFNTTRMPVFVT